jgi:hypothetical protein
MGVELARLPEPTEADPGRLTDYGDTEDRLPEITAACRALRFIALMHPGLSNHLNAAVDIMEAWWPPLTLEE